MEASEAAKNALQSVLEAKETESIVIFCDDIKAEIGKAFQKGAKDLKLHTSCLAKNKHQSFPNRSSQATHEAPDNPETRHVREHLHGNQRRNSLQNKTHPT
jgi:hypothetical protein